MTSLLRTSTLAAAALLLSGSAYASTMNVTVPFAFVVQGHTLPAGRYNVTDDNGVIELRPERGGAPVLEVLSIPASGHDPAGHKPALTFTRHENGYQLSNIWEDSDTGRAPVRN